MEGIHELRRQTVAPVQKAVSQSAGMKQSAAPARTDLFQSRLTEAERAEQAAKTEPLPKFAYMTDRQKLSALATLHDATDYSGMTDIEKYKLMNDRFEAAFPHLRAYEARIFGRDSVSYFGEANMAREVEGTASRIQKEQERQWNSQGLSGISRLHREAYYGGMTDAEAAEAITQRHKGGNLAAQADALQELKLCSLGDSGKIQETLDGIRGKLIQWARRSSAYEGTDAKNATEEELVYALATGSQIRSGKGTDWGALKRLLADSEEVWDKKLAAGYSKQVQQVICDLIDGLIKAEGTQGAPDESNQLVEESVSGAEPE